MNNIYQIEIATPPPDADSPETWKEMARRLTGHPQEDPIHFVQSSTQDDSYRLTIAVPEDMETPNQALAQAGHHPRGVEPEAPLLDEDSVIIPTAFQLRHFGVILNPSSVSNHPQRQDLIAEALQAALPDLPEAARNILNWTGIDQDKNGVATLHWHDPQADPGIPGDQQ